MFLQIGSTVEVVPFNEIVNDNSFDGTSQEDDIHFIDADSMAENDDYFPEETEKYNSDALLMTHNESDYILDEDDESSIYSISSVDFSNSVNNNDIKNILQIASPTTSLMVAGSAIFLICSKEDEVIIINCYFYILLYRFLVMSHGIRLLNFLN